MLSSTLEAPQRPRQAGGREDIDATVVALMTRDPALAPTILEDGMPGTLRLYVLDSTAAALALLADRSPDAFVVDAATSLPEGPAAAIEIAAALRARNVPLVVAAPAGRAAKDFIEECATSAVDTRWCAGRDAAAVGALVHGGIERRRNKLRFAYVLTPLVSR